MKTIIKTTLSLILALCMVLPMTVLAATPDYKDVPKKHWAYEYVMRLAEEGIMHGMVEGVYFNKHGEVRSKELLAVLHRMTGEEEYEELIQSDFFKDSRYKDLWYKDAVLWATNNSVSMFMFTNFIENVPASAVFMGFWGEGHAYNMFVGSRNSADFYCGINGADTVITRSDVLLAFYRYTTKILEKEVSSKGDISVYTDNKKFPTVKIRPDNYVNFLSENAKYYNNCLKMYYGANSDLCDLYGYDALTQIWLWAIDAGIIEGYPDGTLRPDATITRAEFAAMLTRFMDYVK